MRRLTEAVLSGTAPRVTLKECVIVDARGRVEMSVVSELLLDEAAAIPAEGRWLLLGGEEPLLRAMLDEGPGVHWLPLDSRDRDAAPSDVVVRDVIQDSAYDRITLPIPPDRDLARRLLLTAHAALRPDGLLLMAGANAEGAKSVMADASDQFGPPVSDGYRQKHRIARFVRREREAKVAQEPSWSGRDGIRPGSWQPFTVTINGHAIELATQPGVFAGDRLDAGTALLLQHLDVPHGGRVLDVGCGAGVIGIAASLKGAAAIDMVDTNLLAVEAAARNVARLGIPGRVRAGDVYDPIPGERYDLIVSNPPFHRGKAVDLSVANRLIGEAPDHLLPGGQILIVANAFLAYGKQMQRLFRVVETTAATRQYHLLRASDPR